VEEAERVEVGCNFHFQSSATRTRDTAALVPREDTSRFDDLIQIMTSTQATESQWDRAHDELEREFPACNTWLTWWSQPWVASMAFPAKSKVSLELRERVPRTSNAIEHQHSLLNQACGSKHDLVAGAIMLLKHVQERAAMYYVCESKLSYLLGADFLTPKRLNLL
jgi:hypothetical protein